MYWVTGLRVARRGVNRYWYLQRHPRQWLVAGTEKRQDIEFKLLCTQELDEEIAVQCSQECFV